MTNWRHARGLMLPDSHGLRERGMFLMPGMTGTLTSSQRSRVAVQAPSDFIFLPSASRADINSGLADSDPGQTLVCPANAAVSWSGDISLSGRNLIGPGKSAGSPTNVTAGTVSITKHATHQTRLSGFRFTANGQHIDVGGDPSNAFYIVDDCRLANDGAVMVEIATNGGLWKGVDFVAATAHSSDVFPLNLGGVGTFGEASWDAATTMGTDDIGGLTNTYFEDCAWTNFLEVSGDIDNGARVVYRYCTFTDSSLVYHGGGSGTSGQDTSAYGGRHLEIYNCTFVRVSNAVALNKWVWLRGGVMVFANNVLADASSPDGSSFPNKPELLLSCGCPASPSYPMAFQVGQSTRTPDATPNQPCLIFGNTGAGAGSGNFIAISGQSGEGITCGSPGTYIQSGRDYQTSNTWGWTPLAYPHPLAP